MENITNAINDVPHEVWDSNIRNNEFWGTALTLSQINLLTENGDCERFRQTLYVHVIKNDSEFDIYDNNGKIGAPGGRNGGKNPKIICDSKSYMIKFGKTDHYKKAHDQWKGILNRRREDFKDHYHTRENINHPYKVSLNPRKPNSYSDNRIINKNAITNVLHLIINLNNRTSADIKLLEKQLTNDFKNHFLSQDTYLNSRLIPKERINIPIENIIDEQQFLDDITALFTNFENNRIL